MKNIERPEVQKLLSAYVGKTTCPYTDCNLCPFNKVIGESICNCTPNEVLEWFNSEYVEPHKWEQWELEAMKHISNQVKSISYKLGFFYYHGDRLSERAYITFSSMKDGENIYIDEELERNGMHR